MISWGLELVIFYLILFYIYSAEFLFTRQKLFDEADLFLLAPWCFECIEFFYQIILNIGNKRKHWIWYLWQSNLVFRKASFLQIRNILTKVEAFQFAHFHFFNLLVIVFHQEIRLPIPDLIQLLHILLAAVSGYFHQFLFEQEYFLMARSRLVTVTSFPTSRQKYFSHWSLLLSDFSFLPECRRETWWWLRALVVWVSSKSSSDIWKNTK